MKAGFFEVDITPRVGVGLCGFGPYLNRMSIGVRDPIKARAAAFEVEGARAVIVSCDLIGIAREVVERVRALVEGKTGVSADNIMVHSTHTHSGPNTGGYVGWGHIDEPYMELLPGLIAKACIGAVVRLHDVVPAHAVSPCEGIGVNRQYDQDAPPLADCLRDDWRPAKPELTDTQCQVLKFTDAATGRLDGFMAYFSCHPVVCCETTRYIHGDFAGVAMNLLERENPGSVGLFLQGAQGDVNTCVVHKPEQEALLALDIIAARFANSVRAGLGRAQALKVDRLGCSSTVRSFTSKDIPLSRIKDLIAEQEAIVYADGAADTDFTVTMAVVLMITLRGIAARMEAGEDLSRQPAEIQGIRLGPVVFLGAPFEIMQAIKNEVRAAARSSILLVMGLANGSMGYATDKTSAAKGGYAADTGPMIHGRLPYRNIHQELVEALLDTDAILNRKGKKHEE
jgi:hypothetical protein